MSHLAQKMNSIINAGASILFLPCPSWLSQAPRSSQLTYGTLKTVTVSSLHFCDIYHHNPGYRMKIFMTPTIFLPCPSALVAVLSPHRIFTNLHPSLLFAPFVMFYLLIVIKYPTPPFVMFIDQRMISHPNLS